jgi:hypothetical protein
MRLVVAVLTLAVFGPLSIAQSPSADEPAPKFGIPPLSGMYPQTSPKAALESAVKAIDRGRYDYIVAHLLDDAFVEGRIAARARDLTPGTEADLRAKRDRQRQDPAGVPADEKLSMEPRAFAAAVDAEARNRAFKQVVQEVKEKLGEDPEAVKELKRFARDGTVAETGDTATITLRDVKDRKVFLKKAGNRWFVENKQADDTPKPADK